MSTSAFSHDELVRLAKFNPDDLAKIDMCREPHTRLGFGYQLAFICLHNRTPTQQLLEIVEEILTYVGVQLDLSTTFIQKYQKQRRTIINHQQEICAYLNLRPLGETEISLLNAFLFDEACRLEQIGPLPEGQTGCLSHCRQETIDAFSLVETTTGPTSPKSDAEGGRKTRTNSSNRGVGSRPLLAEQ
jgi:hypothetical protein